ncbi:hypothetical protein [Bradyrhizobium sp. WSM471]|uniref:hypothetical protein n=1 Tax=Bradyrhizobium sp. WSM471 TaxID=319017 RepID=UPI00024D2965|nr:MULTISPECIES: hypothetical protein [Bradyrhizobium]EHR02944.1 hypothetical protein Bra471DRAFT_03708 [Bradyrhizobium sp. WSM471]UFW38189.1 hypothetical protein BcanWSM471_18200 [Bradyrhizobium canariense]
MPDTNTDFPLVPELANANSQPPDRSAYVQLQSVDRPLVMWANSDNSSKSAYVCDEPNENLSNTTAIIENYWDGKGPPVYQLVLRQFWRPVGKSYHRIPVGNTLTISVTKTQGVSSTVSQSITASLGISYGALSAEVSATFSKSVTTSDESSYTETVQISPPADGMVRVWVLWQLVHEIVAIQGSYDTGGKFVSNGNVLPKGDRNYANRKAQVAWNGRGRYSSGAWVNYDDTSWLFPSDTFVAYQKDFPASGAVGRLA